VPRLDHIQREVEGVQAQIAHLETRLEALIEMQVNVAEMLHGIRAKLVRVRHPFRRPT